MSVMEPGRTDQQPIQAAPTILRSKTSADESPAKHTGIREVRFVGLVANQISVSQLAFHVTDASKILASVSKMTEAGNEVVFRDPKKYQTIIKSWNGK